MSEKIDIPFLLKKRSHETLEPCKNNTLIAQVGGFCSLYFSSFNHLKRSQLSSPWSRLSVVYDSPCCEGERGQSSPETPILRAAASVCSQEHPRAAELLSQEKRVNIKFKDMTQSRWGCPEHPQPVFQGEQLLMVPANHPHLRVETQCFPVHPFLWKSWRETVHGPWSQGREKGNRQRQPF